MPNKTQIELYRKTRNIRYFRVLYPRKKKYVIKKIPKLYFPPCKGKNKYI